MLITGSNGFIGGSVGRYAGSKGNYLLGIDRTPAAAEGWPGSYVQANIAGTDLAGIIGDFSPDVILHAAGSASVGASIEDPLTDFKTSVITWACTLDGVRRSGVRSVIIFPSSASVYGNPKQLPVGEDAAISPISPYGFNKVACELIAREYCECFGMDIVVARLFSVYGPGQKRLLLWELFSQAAGSESEIVLQGTGKETRDYMHIDDVAEVLLKLANCEQKALTIANVASGKEISTRDLALLVADKAGVDKPVSSLGKARLGNPTNWRAEVGRINELGIFTSRPLSDGVEECVEEWLCE